MVTYRLTVVGSAGKCLTGILMAVCGLRLLGDSVHSAATLVAQEARYSIGEVG